MFQTNLPIDLKVSNIEVMANIGEEIIELMSCVDEENEK